MIQATKTQVKVYFSALALLVVFLFKGFAYLSPRLMHFVSGEYAMQISTEAENKAAESTNEAKEFPGHWNADEFSSLKYPLLSDYFHPRNFLITTDIYLPIITPPPRYTIA